MRRRASSTVDLPGQDSFLDVVANIVGILIILVMVVGVRAGHAPSRAVDQAAEAGSAAVAAKPVEEARREAASVEEELLGVGRQMVLIHREIAARRADRQEWETLVLAGERALDERRRSLDAAARAEYDTARQLEAARADLDQMTREQLSLETTRPESIRIENRPTPLSRTVRGREIHCRLAGGRVTVIPIDRLLERLKNDAEHKAWKLQGQSEVIDTVGPIGGFHLRYRLERFEIPPEDQLETGRGGSWIRLARWDLLPTSSELGETTETALADGSRFRAAIDHLRPHETTVTIWTYPDSFSGVRAITDALYVRDYSVAVRPLPDGVSIGGSPFGSRSSAQ